MDDSSKQQQKIKEKKKKDSVMLCRYLWQQQSGLKDHKQVWWSCFLLFPCHREIHQQKKLQLLIHTGMLYMT